MLNNKLKVIRIFKSKEAGGESELPLSSHTWAELQPYFKKAELDLLEAVGRGKKPRQKADLVISFANPGLATSDDFSDSIVFQAAMDEYLVSRSGPFTTVNSSSAMLSLPQIGGSLLDLKDEARPSSTPIHPGLPDQHTFLRDALGANDTRARIPPTLPRSRGGVVDDSPRVYGVRGLRVVDASVFFLVPQATINSMVIAVAERATDLIKGDYGVLSGN
ncbi:hypothetical protein B0H67DRAFT_644220 [Lasiosphaeris hirsuta]|uniref:Glucose-methanol-choline oxidoreductase C-terminal domain-containing protein n=1 Tax=Lasiosphaeris hirsuta TaxID=260670 RepID=A0AA40AS87_9PEZI|nr:hypothetical protein B0H67DRAFT_644220 [Lasiosphaeris hirsuta]